MKLFFLECSRPKLRGWWKFPEYLIKGVVGIRMFQVDFSLKPNRPCLFSALPDSAIEHTLVQSLPGN